MEKSIESIWKDGFLTADELVAPKLNDLYNKKSGHIVDKFTRMFKVNLIMIVFGSFVLLGLSYMFGVPYLGIAMFILLNILAFINRKLMNGLLEIDKTANSFDYLKQFDGWMKEQISINERFARVLYPMIFISIFIGFWFGEIGGDMPGQVLLNEFITGHPELLLVFGIPWFFFLGGILLLSLLAYFGGKIYQWDLKIVYGRVLKKLEEILADMEELRG